jgi:HK97 gp10 family phage protein
MNVGFRVEGRRLLDGRLKALPENLQRKVIRRGVAAGARVIRQAVKAAAPVAKKPHYRGRRLVQPGTLRRAVVNVWAKELSGRERQSYVVTLLRGQRYQRMGKKGTIDKDAYYWPWVEFGHRVVARASKGGSPTGIAVRRRRPTGFVPAKPFFWPAYARSRARAESEAKETMRRLIRSEL